MEKRSGRGLNKTWKISNITRLRTYTTAMVGKTSQLINVLYTKDSQSEPETNSAARDLWAGETVLSNT